MCSLFDKAGTCRCFTRELEANTESISANDCKGLADVFSQISVRRQGTRNRNEHDQANVVTAQGTLPMGGRMGKGQKEVVSTFRQLL